MVTTATAEGLYLEPQAQGRDKNLGLIHSFDFNPPSPVMNPSSKATPPKPPQTVPLTADQVNNGIKSNSRAYEEHLGEASEKAKVDLVKYSSSQQMMK